MCLGVVCIFLNMGCYTASTHKQRALKRHVKSLSSLLLEFVTFVFFPKCNIDPSGAHLKGSGRTINIAFRS